MESGSRVFLWIVVLIIIIGGGWWLYSRSASAPTETGPIKIGFIGPLTGDTASLGTAARAGTELAVEEINAAGGINGRQIEAIYEDGRCTSQPASSAASKLINADKVSAIIGGLCSSETAAFAPTAMAAKIPVISYCSSAPNLSQTGKYFFRDYPSDAYQGKYAAEYAYNTLGARKVAVIYHISDWGTGIKNVFQQRFRELGGQIVAEEGTPQTARDYRTQLQKVKDSKPDYLYTPTYAEGGTVLLKQASEMKLGIKILGADAWGDTKLHSDAKGFSLDILYVEPKTGSTSDFDSKVLAKTGGQQVPICAAQAYDAVQTLAKAVKSSGTDPDKLADAIRATNFTGISGPISFDQNGDLKTAVYVVKRIANGTATEVQ